MDERDGQERMVKKKKKKKILNINWVEKTRRVLGWRGERERERERERETIEPVLASFLFEVDGEN